MDAGQRHVVGDEDSPFLLTGLAGVSGQGGFLSGVGVRCGVGCWVLVGVWWDVLLLGGGGRVGGFWLLALVVWWGFGGCWVWWFVVFYFFGCLFGRCFCFFVVGFRWDAVRVCLCCVGGGFVFFFLLLLLGCWVCVFGGFGVGVGGVCVWGLLVGVGVCCFGGVVGGFGGFCVGGPVGGWVGFGWLVCWVVCWLWVVVLFFGVRFVWGGVGLCVCVLLVGVCGGWVFGGFVVVVGGLGWCCGVFGGGGNYFCVTWIGGFTIVGNWPKFSIFQVACGG